MRQAAVLWDVFVSRFDEAQAGYHRRHLTAEEAGQRRFLPEVICVSRTGTLVSQHGFGTVIGLKSRPFQVAAYRTETLVSEMVGLAAH